MRAPVCIAAGITFLAGTMVMTALPASAEDDPDFHPDDSDLPVPFEDINIVPFDAFENDLPVPFEDVDIVPF